MVDPRRDDDASPMPYPLIKKGNPTYFNVYGYLDSIRKQTYQCAQQQQAKNCLQKITAETLKYLSIFLIWKSIFGGPML